MKSEDYFYLDGADKKGPYSKKEIIDLNLSDETLVYSENLNKWIPLKELIDFQAVVKEIQIENHRSLTKQNSYFPNILVLLFLVLMASGIAYYLTKEIRQKDFQKLEQVANAVFEGKSEICDYTKSGVTGKLTKPNQNSFFGIVNKKVDNEGNELVEYYNCDSGGWTVYTLKKLNHGYDLIESSSTNMGFKVPETTYHAGTNYGYGLSTPGYYLPTYRGTVQNAYNEAMEFISVDKEDKSYVPGSFDRIITFDELYSNLHYMDNIDPTRYTSASVNSRAWKSVGEASVYNDNWIVWYQQSGKHFEIVLSQKTYNEKLLLNLGIGIAIAIFAFLLWIYSKKGKITN